MQKDKFMKKAIQLAIDTIDNGNTPFGAVVTKGGEIVGLGLNRVTSDNDPTAHAEILAIKDATKTLGRGDLSDCELYASGEPCLMCTSAVYFANIKTVYVAYFQEEASKYDLGKPYVSEQIILPKNERDISFIQHTPANTKHPYKLWKNQQ